MKTGVKRSSISAAHALLDQDLAAGVGGLRRERAGLGAHLVAAGAVGRAGRGLDEALRPRPRAPSRPRPTEPLWLISMVSPGSFSPIGSLESSARCTTASKPAQVVDGDPALVLGDHRRMGAAVVEEPAAAVEAGVEPDHLVAGLDQLRAHDRADIAVGPGQEYAHRFPYSSHSAARAAGAGGPRPSRAPCRCPTSPAARACRAACPCSARSPCGGRPRAGRRRPGAFSGSSSQTVASPSMIVDHPRLADEEAAVDQVAVGGALLAEAVDPRAVGARSRARRSGRAAAPRSRWRACPGRGGSRSARRCRCR